jgi:hypothetical protein
MEDIITMNKVKQIKDQTNFLVDKATSGPVADSMAHRIEDIQTFQGNVFQTIQFYLIADGSSHSVDLSNISGTVKSAFIEVNGEIVSYFQSAGGTGVSNIAVTINFGGSGIVTNDQFVHSVYMNGGTDQDHSGGAGVGRPVYDVTANTTLGTTNSYTITYTETDGGGLQAWNSQGAVLTITYEPS